MTHTHKWKHYEGLLGYESFKCTVCDIDANDLSQRLTLKQLENLHIDEVQR